MVHQWECRECEFTAWSSNQSEIADVVKSHLFSHYKSAVTSDELGVSWECPYCDHTSQGYDTDESVDKFKEHLLKHVSALIDSGVHVADEIDRVGNVLVLSALESAGADNARVHFTSPADIAVFVTNDPAERVRLLDNRLQSWPAWTTILTTKSQPFADVTDVDLDTAPLDVAILDKGISITDLGETIARVLDEQQTSNSRVTVGFDILSELLSLFDTETAFKFVHVLNSRLTHMDALTHYYLNPNSHPSSEINVLKELFDLRIQANGSRFTTL
ncbi:MULTISPECIES: DUF7504 family protein [Haloarcula]|uniref:DUF7504 family protein n=1 Tax=Haloarcula TaxID=2237 RepID=UPI0023EBD2EB|nr:hypothetical protein [Halomicroarcula sp. XH51]